MDFDLERHERRPHRYLLQVTFHELYKVFIFMKTKIISKLDSPLKKIFVFNKLLYRSIPNRTARQHHPENRRQDSEVVDLTKFSTYLSQYQAVQDIQDFSMEAWTSQS